MEENKKTAIPVDESIEKDIVGGYAGKDAFDIAQYNKAGISFEHNIWSKDRYCYEGQYITQKQAEVLTKYYNKFGYKCSLKDYYTIEEFCKPQIVADK